jgi:D-alanyl-D-alanine carboxypeptidase
MRELISKYIRVAALQRNAPKLDTVAQMKNGPPKPQDNPTPVQTASALPVSVPNGAPPAVSDPSTSPPPGSTEPIRPTAVKTVKVKTARAQPASEAGAMMPPAHTAMVTTIATKKVEPPEIEEKPAIVGTVPIPPKAAKAPDNAPSARRAGEYLIQVGAFDEESEAKNRLSVARSIAKNALDNADPFTERVDKGNKAMYRARFAGFDKGQAETACKSLRRGEIPCMMLKN